MKHMLEVNRLEVVDEEEGRTDEESTSKIDEVFAQATMPPPFVVVVLRHHSLWQSNT